LYKKDNHFSAGKKTGRLVLMVLVHIHFEIELCITQPSRAVGHGMRHQTLIQFPTTKWVGTSATHQLLSEGIPILNPSQQRLF
jgi:hypothetical protein